MIPDMPYLSEHLQHPLLRRVSLSTSNCKLACLLRTPKRHIAPYKSLHYQSRTPISFLSKQFAGLTQSWIDGGVHAW